MDGVTGIYSPDDKELAEKVFLSTGAIQHRGKAAAGVAFGNGKGIHIHKELGRIGDVVDSELIAMIGDLEPTAAIGNVGYTKSKTPTKHNAEPIRVNPRRHSSLDVVLTMDGYLVQEGDLRQELSSDYYFETTNKTEVMGALFHKYLLESGITFDAGRRFVDRLHGLATFAITALVYDGKNTHLLSLNDDRAFEPSCIGTIDNALVVSSESVSHRRLGGNIERECNGAEMTICSPDGIDTQRLREEVLMPDIFQGVYFGNVASLFRGKEIFQLRTELGHGLVDLYGVPNADIVIPNPESGWGVTMGIYEGMFRRLEENAFDYSRRSEGVITVRDTNAFDKLMQLKTVYPALIKLAQAVRTFQEGEQRQRTAEVGLKFGSVDSLLKDAHVVMGDDSIVKGSVSEGGSVWSVYNSGAKNLEFWISYGPMFFPSFKEWHRGEECLHELAVRKAFKGDSCYVRSLDEINTAVARKVGVDSVRYNTMEVLENVAGPGSHQAMDASYPIDEKFWPDWIKREVQIFNDTKL